MASRNRGAPIPTPIESLEQYQELLENTSQTRLIIIDCYLEWCGPTLAMSTFWDKLWTSMEKCAARLELYSLCIDSADFDESLKKKISAAAMGEGIRTEAQGCKPFFVFLRFGSAVGAVDGINASGINLMLELHAPKIEKKEDEKK
jgi:hypothetical protein